VRGTGGEMELGGGFREDGGGGDEVQMKVGNF